MKLFTIFALFFVFLSNDSFAQNDNFELAKNDSLELRNCNNSMILPIYVYGQDVLREDSQEVAPDYKDLPQLLENMYATMYAADGIGLSACQIGLPLQLFVVDIAGFYESEEDLAEIGDDAQREPFKRVFINPRIIESSEEQEPYNEGCLSLPGINENVLRPNWIVLRYQDENFVEHTQKFDAMWARVIQHEYDHVIGKVFTDRLAPIRRQMVRSKLQGIARGVHNAKYRVK